MKTGWNETNAFLPSVQNYACFYAENMHMTNWVRSLGSFQKIDCGPRNFTHL